MLLKTPYDAPVMKAYDLKKIQSQVAEAIVAGEYASREKLDESAAIYRTPNPMWDFELANDVVAIVKNTDWKTTVDPFPIPFKMRTAAGKELYVLDARMYTAPANHYRQYGIMHNPSEIGVYSDIISWMRCWDAREGGDIRRVHDYVTGTFANWIASAVSRITGVNGGEDYDIIRFLAAYWFQAQFSEVPYEVTVEERLRMRRVMTNCWPRPDSVVDLQTKDFGYIGNLEDFLEAVKKQLPNNRRVHMLNRAYFTQQIANSWRGFHAGVMCNVAMEYPPFFIAMYYYSLTNSWAKDVGLGKVAQNLRDTQKRADFLASYRRTINVWKQP